MATSPSPIEDSTAELHENAPDAPPTTEFRNRKDPDAKSKSAENVARGESVAITEDFEMGDPALDKDATLHHPADQTDILTHTIHLEDDATLPAITFRSVLLGIGLSVFGGVLSGIYYFKPQTVVITPVFLAVVSFILGELMARTLPRTGKLGFLNPHDFNVKEHLLIVIMANAASISALGIEIISVERLYYGKRLSSAISIFLLLSSQFLGYGIAGLMRKTMVYPKAMLWPANLPVNSMLETLHRRSPETRKPLKVFLIVFGCIFLWEIIPEWICPILTGVSVFCLANQNSTVFTYIFGGASGNEGLGLFSLCFDWQYISGGYSPLYYPMDSLISQGIGICACIVVFASLFYANVWNAMQYPFLGQVILSDRSTPGNPIQWNQLAAIGPDNRINMTAVETLGLPAFSSSNVLNLLLTNMSAAAAIVHMFIWFPREMKASVAYLDPRGLRNWRQIPGKIRRMFEKSDQPDDIEDYYDPHYTLMTAYKACPNWWFGIVLLMSFVIGISILYAAKSTLPWWGFIVAIILGYVLIVILGTMQAVTGVTFTCQSIVQMIGGYIQPGNPVANMYFSLYGYNSLLQGVLLGQDLKLAQYGHLAPRITFAAQMFGSIIGAMFNYILANSIITNQFEILRRVEGTNIWSGQAAQQFNGQAVAFGGLPHQLFSVGGKYEWVTLSILPAFFVPIPLWLAHRRWPDVGFNNVNTVVVLYYLCYLNVGINSSILSFFVIGLGSQWWLRKYRPNVFVRYNYLVSAALDGGTSVIVFILSFAVLGAAGKAVQFPIYWGNNVKGNIDRCKYVD